MALGGMIEHSFKLKEAVSKVVIAIPPLAGEAIWLNSSIDNEIDCVGRVSLTMTNYDF